MEETTKALTKAALLFNTPLDADQLRGYLTVLAMSGAADRRLAQGVLAACASCQFMPRPADILNHLPAVNPQDCLPAADEDQIPIEEQRFGRDVLPQLNRFLRGEITYQQLMANMRHLARQHGVESRIVWDQEGDQ